MLRPAACYHVYPLIAARGPLPAAGVVLTLGLLRHHGLASQTWPPSVREALGL